MKYVGYLIIGFLFGVVLFKSEAVSWYRIIEMFQFKSFHLFGVIGTAIFVGALSVLMLKKYRLKSFSKERLNLSRKPLTPRANILGGIIFGLGWAIVGACPAPLFIHLGMGNWIIILPILGAILGVLLYGLLNKYLPH